MADVSALKKFVRSMKGSPVYRFAVIPRRALIGGRTALRDIPAYLGWLFTSREETNFTYDLTEMNLKYLANALSLVTGHAPQQARAYIDELLHDEDLRAHILKRVKESPFRSVSDDQVRYAKRLGWYAIVRLAKPKIVVETGVDKGLGSVVLCKALMRNAAEGHPGRFIGTDINPAAGWMLTEPYTQVGEIRVGDSIETLKKMTEQIDIFINDSDHSVEYEAREYDVIVDKLAPGAIILGDNAHDNTSLSDFSLKHGRAFLFFREDPERHWYRGGGIGFSFIRK